MRPSDAPEITRSRKAAERQRKREAGLVQVTVWVPKKERDSIKARAQSLCDHDADPTPHSADNGEPPP